MGVVDKVMVWLGFERYEQPATPTSQAKVLYKKRDVDISTARNLLAASSDGENAARAHVELTPFDKAILWIFEKIISPFMNPLPAESTELVTGRQFIDSTSINNISEEEIRAKFAQGEFDKSRNFIKVFLEKKSWPTSGNVHSDEVREVATSHWKNYESLPDKSSANEEDRLTYAAAAYVLGKGNPSFEPLKMEPQPVVNSSNDDRVVEQDEISVAAVLPPISNGEKLFRQFVKLSSSPDFKDVDSLGSLFFQAECLDFARKITESNAIAEIKNRQPPDESEVNAADYLQKRKTTLEGEAEEAERRRAARANLEKMENEKKQLRPGEWDFNKFTEKFKEKRDSNQRFIIQKNGKYLANEELLNFSAMVRDDASFTADQKQAADYLSKWRANQDASTDAAAKSPGFSLPPEPPKPAARRVLPPKVEPPQVPPEIIAMTEFIKADAQQHEALHRLIPVSEPVFRSGMAVFRQIWLPDLLDKNAQNDPESASARSDAGSVSYTDLEKADNALSVMHEIFNIKTGHNIALSNTIEAIKLNRDAINRNLSQYRRQIIEGRKILAVQEMTQNQMHRGQELFDEFLISFSAADARGEIDNFIMRDIYFSDECISYASYMYDNFSKLSNLATDDQKAQQAAGYLMNKYHLFKSLGSEPARTDV